MATKYWKASGFTNQTWSTGANWEGEAAPGAADDAVFNAGSNPVDGGDMTAVAHGKVIVTSDYTGAIGTVGAQLQLDLDELVFSGLGVSNYFLLDPDAGDVVVTVNGTGTGADALHIDGVTLGAFLTCVVRKGNVTIDSGAVLTANASIVSSYITTAATDVALTISTSVTNLASLVMTGGVVALASACTTIDQYAGVLTTSSSGAITTVNLFAGTNNHGTTGTLTTLNLFGGTFDASGNSSAKIISNVLMYAGALNINNGARNITLSADIISYTTSPSITAATAVVWDID